MKKYTIEMWMGDRWQLVLGVPQRFATREAAEKELRFQAATTPPRRCRLCNGKGSTVLYAGVNEAK